MEQYKNADGTVKIKKVIFNNGSPDFIYTLENWQKSGGYQGFIKDNAISIADILKVDGGCMTEKELYELPDWEG